MNPVYLCLLSMLFYSINNYLLEYRLHYASAMFIGMIFSFGIAITLLILNTTIYYFRPEAYSFPKPADYKLMFFMMLMYVGADVLFLASFNFKISATVAAIVMCAMPLFILIWKYLLQSEPLNYNHLISYGFMVVAIYFFTRG